MLALISMHGRQMVHGLGKNGGMNWKIISGTFVIRTGQLTEHN